MNSFWSDRKVLVLTLASSIVICFYKSPSVYKKEFLIEYSEGFKLEYDDFECLLCLLLSSVGFLKIFKTPLRKCLLGLL